MSAYSAGLPGDTPQTRAAVYQVLYSAPAETLEYVAGCTAGHAAPHARGVDAATFIAADSVMPVVPSYAATVVPAVMPVPVILAPTIGLFAVAGVAVSVNVTDKPAVLPSPLLCDVKMYAMPEMTRSFSGPLPKSYGPDVLMTFGHTVGVCACAPNAAHSERNSDAKSFFMVLLLHVH